MFVESNNCREIYNNFFLNNKELPKGNISERFVYLTLQLFDNPKGNSAYKNIFDMSNENHFVAQDTCVQVTPAQQALLALVSTPSKARELYIYLFEILILSTYHVDRDLINQEAACGVLEILHALRALQEPSPILQTKNNLS